MLDLEVLHGPAEIQISLPVLKHEWRSFVSPSDHVIFCFYYINFSGILSGRKLITMLTEPTVIHTCVILSVHTCDIFYIYLLLLGIPLKFIFNNYSTSACWI